jgi:adenylate kinase
LDEIDLLIKKEEMELSRIQKEAEENSVREAKLAKEKKIKDDAMAAKMEDIRKQERDLLDQRSQPIRQYLMDNVVPHLTEGLIELCKKVPEDAIDHLANFLLERADLIDEQHIKKREEEFRLKQEQKR